MCICKVYADELQRLHSVFRISRICSHNRIRLNGITVAIAMEQFASLEQSLEVYPIRFCRSIGRSFLTNQPMANNGPKISIDNNPLSIDRRSPEEVCITTGTIINCGYYRKIAVLNHARYASANISPSRDRARDRTMASRKCIDRFRRIFMQCR